MHIITASKGIEELFDHFYNAKTSYVAIDTEFVRQKTFYPELSLIQVSFDGECYIIDTLSLMWHPNCLKDLIFKDFLTIVFHSCRQDLEIFFHLYKKLPSYIFDTQIGAVFVGLGDNLSYHALVKHYLNLDIDKSQQHTDWLKRPLDYDQVQYAAKDVIYLADLYPLMVDDLKQRGRFEWALDEMGSLSQLTAFSRNQASHLKKLGVSRSRYAFAKEILRFREKHASALNINRSRFLSDKTILTMTTFHDSEKLRDFLLRTTSLEDFSLIDNLLILFETYRDVKNEEKKTIISKSQEKQIRELRNLCDEKAHKLELSNSFFANSEDIQNSVLYQSGRLHTTWRKNILGF